MSHDQERFAVLFVCTGNICRSPMAERLFRARISSAAPISSGSAGVAGLVGCPMDRPSALVLRELGVDPDVHVSRRLNNELVNCADLILTAEAAHRSVIVRADPLTARRVFTLREFARLGAGLPVMNGAPPNGSPPVNALRDVGGTDRIGRR